MDDVHKICTHCNQSKPLSEFYSKGGRTDSRCRPCTLGIKKKARQLKKAAKKKKPRGRVIDVSALNITIASSEISSAVFKEWVELTIGV